jgi:hypothetical protein
LVSFPHNGSKRVFNKTRLPAESVNLGDAPDCIIDIIDILAYGIFAVLQMPEILHPLNSKDSPHRLNSTACVAKSTLQSLRVLVVDDDPLIRAILKGYLEK